MLTQQQRYAGLTADQARQLAAAEAAMQAHRLDDAAHSLDTLAASARAHPEALRLHGTLACLQGRANAALEPLVTALQQRPDDELAYSFLGASYERLGDQDNALKAFRQACEKAPDQVLHWVNFGNALSRAGWYEHAIAILGHALKLQPANRDARAMLGMSLSLDGRSDEAVGEYRRLLADDPTSGTAWWGLVLIRPMPLDAADIEQMRAVLADAQMDPGNKVALRFALAHAMEHTGDYRGAFESLQAAHALACAQRKPWNADEAREFTQQCLDQVVQPPVPEPDQPGHEVIFIVSLPRSGSTLVEQILASHSQVAGTIELRDLFETLLAESDRQGKAYPDWMPSLSDSQWPRLGQAYLERTARWRQHKPRMTDKMLGNWRHIGAILSMLPNARIVAVHRDPLENCLACYRMLLDGHDYTHRFEDLAEFQRQYETSVEEWQRRCPERVRVQSYELLTREPEQQIRQLLDFCDLPFERACDNFHQTRRRVSTMSTAQVREPIHPASARAEMYGNLLDPLRDAIAQARERGIDRKPAS